MAKVLIVEDETAYQKILKDTLEKEHLEVFLTPNVKQAIVDVANIHPNVILLDIMLPGGLNGFDFLESIKADEKTKDIPVIIITNLSSEEKVAKEMGAVFYFTKADTTIEKIVEKVREVVK